MGLFGFGGGRRSVDRSARLQVEAWARAAGRYPPATVLKVSELLCSDPACPGLETVILIMVPGERTRACKIGKPLAEVGEADVAEALRRTA